MFINPNPKPTRLIIQAYNYYIIPYILEPSYQQPRATQDSQLPPSQAELDEALQPLQVSKPDGSGADEAQLSCGFKWIAPHPCIPQSQITT